MPLALVLDAPPDMPIDRPGGKRTAAFFTGGVDSSYTLLKHADAIEALIFVHGFDVALDNRPLSETVSRTLRTTADRFGKPLIEVRTNLRMLLDSHGDWATTTHGAALATVAHLLNNRYDRILVAASSHNLALAPWGSHPLFDLLWSSESLRLQHDGGEATRFSKVKRIAQSSDALAGLRICWENRDNSFNCGLCEKCLRTMLQLEAVGALTTCGTLEDTLPAARIAAVRFIRPTQRICYYEMLRDLSRSNARPDVQRILLNILWPFRRVDRPEHTSLLYACRTALRRNRLNAIIRLLRKPSPPKEVS